MTNLQIEANPVKNPNLLLNQEEIEQVKSRIKDYDWAGHLFEKLKSMAEKGSVRDKALCYAITSDMKYADSVKQWLLDNAQYSIPRYEKLDLNSEPEYGAWTEWGAYAWAYDLTYHLFSSEERETIKKWLIVTCKTVIEGEKIRTTTPISASTSTLRWWDKDYKLPSMKLRCKDT